MARARIEYHCTQCGFTAGKWLGRCSDCGEWNTLIEKAPEPPQDKRRLAGRALDHRPLPITQLSDATDGQRLVSGIDEFDRILGGGLVPGSVTLIGGPPGVGKSTLLMQVALALVHGGHRVLYASGEESTAQVRSRTQRLGELCDRLYLQAETDVQRILEGAEQVEPAVLVIDSVQTVFAPDLGSTPGSVSQVREVAARLVLHAKATGRAVLVVGHVTKDGQLAGPRTLEHVVDAVVYFEDDATPPYRVLRGRKNRFGATGELGLFEMTGQGLVGIPEPSKALLQDRPTGRPGTAVTAVQEGSRTLLLEVQALVAPGFPGSTRRTALGVDSGRLAMLVAVLGKADFTLHDKDVFVNVAGGMRVTETGADLAVAAAVVGSLTGRALPPDQVVLGEIGLTGEVRSVPGLEARLHEAARHGFRRALVPRLPGSWSPPRDLAIESVVSVEDAMREAFFS